MMEDFFEKHLAAYAASDWDAYKADLLPDVIYEEIATGTRVTGADEYLEAVSRWKAAFPDLKATILRTLVFGDVGVAEVEWEGTQSGALETSFGTPPATNKRVSVKGVIISRLKDGKLAESRHYFDQLTLLRNLGAGPFAGAAVAREAPQPELRH
jgi:steroid delta-isomerase-like uncharacterized protein